MDDLTIKVQMAAQRQLLRSMDAESERDAALARAEAAEAALANCQHDLATMENKVDQANAALEAMRTPCVWRKEYGGWITGGCSNRPIVFAGGFSFCPYCGHPIEVQP